MTAAMAHMRPCAAVIFDMDGVLLDTEPLYTRATNRVLAAFDAQLSWPLKSRIMGREPMFGAELVLSSLNVPLDPVTYLERVDAELRPLLVQAEPIPGVRLLLAELKRRGVPVAVATSSSRERFELKAERNTWLRELVPIVCGDDHCVKQRKPAPDIFLAAAAALQIEPARCLAFEDSPSGVQAARAAGMQVIGLLAPGLTQEQLAEADMVIESYAEISIEMFHFLNVSGDEQW